MSAVVNDTQGKMLALVKGGPGFQAMMKDTARVKKVWNNMSADARLTWFLMVLHDHDLVDRKGWLEFGETFAWEVS